MKLRRKSLAILYYLAVEGATRRQLLADLLWEQVDSSQNLRVELHHLRKILTDLGVQTFARNMDPLQLPAEIRLDENGPGGELLEGLEGLSPTFQAWLEGQRALAEKGSSALLVQRNLLESVARRIRIPHLLILSAEPDSGQQAFISALAARLGLRKTEELAGSGPALRHLPADQKYDDDVVRRIVDDDSSLWVVERPRFGEDSAFLLKLRGSQQPQRMSYLELPGLSWRELKAQLDGSLSFREAAELYSRTSGHSGYLRELLDLQRAARPAAAAQLPQRIRAAYGLEARRLSIEARYALERASVHPGPLSDGLLRALEVEAHLVELERRNWLILDSAWRFRGEVSRSAIYLSLPKGQARLYHQRAAAYLESIGTSAAAEYHRSLVAGAVDWGRAGEELSGWGKQLTEERAGDRPADTPTPRRVLIRDEVPLLESRLFGEQVEAEGGRATLIRQPLELGESGAEWQLLIPKGVLHLRGSVFARSALDVGLEGDAAPLTVEFLGATPRTVVYAKVQRPRKVDDQTLLLPLQEELDSFLEFEDSLFVRVTSSAEAAVVELTLTAYEAKAAADGEGVQAF